MDELNGHYAPSAESCQWLADACRTVCYRRAPTESTVMVRLRPASAGAVLKCGFAAAATGRVRARGKQPAAEWLIIDVTCRPPAPQVSSQMVSTRPMSTSIAMATTAYTHSFHVPRRFCDESTNQRNTIASPSGCCSQFISLYFMHLSVRHGSLIQQQDPTEKSTISISVNTE